MLYLSKIGPGTHAAVVYVNQICGYLEDKLFNTCEVFSHDMVKFFLENFFRFLVNVKYNRKESINVSPSQKLMNSLDLHIKFIFENVFTAANFLNVSCSIKMINLYLVITENLHIYFLTCITAAVTCKIVSENKEQYFNKSKSCLI